jgi:hypothetical protein
MGILRAEKMQVLERQTALSWWKYVSKLSSDAKWKDTTRARANALREYLTHSEKDNKFNHKELYDVLSCEQSLCQRMSK